MTSFKLNIIAAVADNGAIGKDNRLLWHIKEDLQYFKKVTMGCPVIMGRKNFESLGRPLPGRLNIVVSRSGMKPADGIRTNGICLVSSLEEALRDAERSFSYEDFRKAEEGAEADTPATVLGGLFQESDRYRQDERNVFIIGGGEMYRQTIHMADRLYITEVHKEVRDADTFFPEIDMNEWKEESRSEKHTDISSGLEYEFVVYSRSLK